MALENTISTPNGVALPKAYTKIVRVDVLGQATAEKDPAALTFIAQWSTFADKNARVSKAAEVATGQHSFDADVSQPLLPQAYAALKQSERFQNSTDC